MVRRNKKVNSLENNSLAESLEAGTDIIGLVGYVPITHTNQDDEYETEIFVKVKIDGVKVEGCGIKVIAELLSGKGRILISPCQFVDNIKEVEDRREQSKRLKQALLDFKELGKPYYHHQRIRGVLDYVHKMMTADQRQEFLLNVKNETNGKLEKVNKHQLKDLAAIASAIVNNVIHEELDSYPWRWSCM